MSEHQIDKWKRTILIPIALFMAGAIAFPAFSIAYTSSRLAAEGRNTQATIIRSNQQAWCDLLRTVTETAPVQVPKPTASSPLAQKNAYRADVFYKEMLGIERKFQC